MLCDGLLQVTGGKDVYVSTTLTGAVSGTGRFLVPATTGSLEVRGEVDQLVLFNANGLSQHRCEVPGLANRTQERWQGSGTPRTGEFVVRATPVNNNTVVYSIPVRYGLTVSAIKTWSKTVPTGAACTLAVAGGGHNLLSATPST
ncbi:MAG: hypothetical protein U1F43_26180 [Myxococcota bacterium]